MWKSALLCSLSRKENWYSHYEKQKSLVKSQILKAGERHIPTNYENYLEKEITINTVIRLNEYCRNDFKFTSSFMKYCSQN